MVTTNIVDIMLYLVVLRYKMFPLLTVDSDELSYMKGKFSNPLAYVQVNDVVYELLGDISSSDSEGSLEHYLTNIKQPFCDSQGEKEIARTKQTAKKSDPKTGLLPATFPTPKGARQGHLRENVGVCQQEQDLHHPKRATFSVLMKQATVRRRYILET